MWSVLQSVLCLLFQFAFFTLTFTASRRRMKKPARKGMLKTWIKYPAWAFSLCVCVLVLLIVNVLSTVNLFHLSSWKIIFVYYVFQSESCDTSMSILFIFSVYYYNNDYYLRIQGWCKGENKIEESFLGNVPTSYASGRGWGRVNLPELNAGHIHISWINCYKYISQ